MRGLKLMAAALAILCSACVRRPNYYIAVTTEVNGMATFFDEKGDAIIFIEANGIDTKDLRPQSRKLSMEQLAKLERGIK